MNGARPAIVVTPINVSEADATAPAAQRPMARALLASTGGPTAPTWIWSVVVNGEVYTRAYNGTRSRWYQAALRQRAVHVSAAGRRLAQAVS